MKNFLFQHNKFKVEKQNKTGLKLLRFSAAKKAGNFPAMIGDKEMGSDLLIVIKQLICHVWLRGCLKIKGSSNFWIILAGWQVPCHGGEVYRK